jgi:hypothetical protein
VVVDGTVTATGQNTFNGNVGIEHQTGYQAAGIVLSPSGSAPSMILDFRQQSLPIQGNQRTLMGLPASVYEPAAGADVRAILDGHDDEGRQRSQE